MAFIMRDSDRVKAMAYLERMRFLCERINEANERRHELVRAGASKAEIEKHDKEEFEKRHKREQL